MPPSATACTTLYTPPAASGMRSTSTRQWRPVTSATVGTASTGPDAAMSGSQYLMMTSATPQCANTGFSVELAPLNNPSGGAGVTMEVSLGYYMYGSGVGSLSIETLVGATWTKAWGVARQQQTSGSQPWRTAAVNVTVAAGSSVRVRVRAQTGTSGSALGDIAIDNVCTAVRATRVAVPSAPGAREATVGAARIVGPCVSGAACGTLCDAAGEAADGVRGAFGEGATVSCTCDADAACDGATAREAAAGRLVLEVSGVCNTGDAATDGECVSAAIERLPAAAATCPEGSGWLVYTPDSVQPVAVSCATAASASTGGCAETTSNGAVTVWVLVAAGVAVCVSCAVVAAVAAVSVVVVRRRREDRAKEAAWSGGVGLDMRSVHLCERPRQTEVGFGSRGSSGMVVEIARVVAAADGSEAGGSARRCSVWMQPRATERVLDDDTVGGAAV